MSLLPIKPMNGNAEDVMAMKAATMIVVRMMMAMTVKP